MRKIFFAVVILTFGLLQYSCYAQQIIPEAVFGAGSQRCNFFNYKGPSSPSNVEIYQVNSAIGVNGISANTMGSIYSGAWDNLLYAFTKNLKQKWTFKTDGKIRRGPLVVNDSIIYFGSTDGYFYSILDKGNEATLNWKFKTDSAIWSYPIKDENENVYFGSDDGFIYSLTTSGKLNWKYGPLGSRPNDGVTITHEGNIVFGTWDGNVYSISSTGTLQWKHNIGNSIRAMASISSENNIYVGNTGGFLYCFNSHGDQKFKLKIDGAIRNSICINPKNEIFFGTANNSRNGSWGTSGSLYKVSSKGEIIWKMKTKDVISGGILDNNSNFYCGSDYGQIFCYNNQGKIKWTYDRDYPKSLLQVFRETALGTRSADGPGSGGEVMILSNTGALFFGSDIGLLYRISEGKSSLKK